MAIVERADLFLDEVDFVTYERKRRTRYRIRHLERLPLGTPYPDVVARVRAVTRSGAIARRCTLVMDATGVGAPVLDLLRRAGLTCAIEPVIFTGGDREQSGGGDAAFGVEQQWPWCYNAGLIPMLRFAPLIVKSSLRNRRRSILTTASMAVSLSLLGTLMAVYHAFYYGEAPPEQAMRLVTRNRVSPAVLMPIAYQERIKGVPGVRDVMGFQWFGGVYKEPKNIFARYAVDPVGVFALHPEYNVAEEQKTAFQRDRAGALVGAGLARRYGWKIGDRVTLKGDIFPVTLDLTVRAIFECLNDDDVMFFSIQFLFEKLPQRRRNSVVAFLVMADDPQLVPRVSRAIDDLFRNAPIQTRTEAERAFTLSFLSMLGNVKAFLISICGALTFTLLLVSANTMAMSTRERLREVGVLKTLGFQQSTVLGLILGEAALLSLSGAAIGAMIAAGLTAGVRSLPAIILQLSGLTLEPVVVLVLLLTGLSIGVMSALIPALNAARTPILVLLKSSE